MILGIFLFSILLGYLDKPEFGQPFMGAEYKRDPNRSYSHSRKRKKFANGRWGYIN